MVLIYFTDKVTRVIVDVYINSVDSISVDTMVSEFLISLVLSSAFSVKIDMAKHTVFPLRIQCFQLQQHTMAFSVKKGGGGIEGSLSTLSAYYSWGTSAEHLNSKESDVLIDTFLSHSFHLRQNPVNMILSEGLKWIGPLRAVIHTATLS